MLEALEAGGFHHGDVYLADRSDELTLLSVQGPYSHRLLQPRAQRLHRGTQTPCLLDRCLRLLPLTL
eukprot:COSAG01_NODE_25108_length_755_cov_1.175305_1_plen_66_part_10